MAAVAMSAMAAAGATDDERAEWRFEMKRKFRVDVKRRMELTRHHMHEASEQQARKGGGAANGSSNAAAGGSNGGSDTAPGFGEAFADAFKMKRWQVNWQLLGPQLLYRHDGRLEPTMRVRRLIAEAKRVGVKPERAAQWAKEETDNVARMLAQFESGRLANHGSFDVDAVELETGVTEGGRAGAAASGSPPGSSSSKQLAALSEDAPDDGLTNEQLFKLRQKRGGGGGGGGFFSGLRAGSSATSLRMGGDLGDISLPPNHMTDDEWLIDCVKLFREQLDLNLTREIPKPKPYVATTQPPARCMHAHV